MNLDRYLKIFSTADCEAFVLPYSAAQPIILRELESHLGAKIHTSVEQKNRGDDAPDLEVETSRGRFWIEYKYTGNTALVTQAVHSLKHWMRQERSGAVALVVVPYMGEAGQRICREGGMSWMDLSGNAEISYRSVRISVLGRPNRYKSSGVPSNVFAPRSSRISRLLLLRPGDALTQSEIVHETGLDQGQVSKVVRQMERDGLVQRGEARRVRVTDPDLLLGAWAEAYRFGDHRITRGHIAARSATTLAEELSERLREAGVLHAATGLAAAWRYTPHAMHRIVTFYVEAPPSPAWFESVRFRSEEDGGNVWIVVPRDEGVFMGMEERARVPCVSPVQVYLDLLAHPERAREAAEELRKTVLTWRARA